MLEGKDVGGKGAASGPIVRLMRHLLMEGNSQAMLCISN